MPLADKMTDKMNAYKYVQHHAPTAHEPRPEKRSMTPQPNTGRERSQQRQDEHRRKLQSATNNKQGSGPISREEAVALKLEVPDTLSRSRLSSTLPPNPAEDQGAAQHDIYSKTMPITDGQHYGFDNTESIIFNDSASLTDEMQDPTQPALDYRYNRNSPRPAGYREPLSLFENLEGPGIGPGWQAEVDEERARRGLNPAYDPRFNHNIYQTASVQDDENDESIHDGDLEEGTSIVQNTPSRTRVVVKEDIGTRHGQQKPKRSLRADDLRNQSVVPRHQKSSSDVAVRIAVEPPLRQRHDRFHIYKPHDADAEPKIPFEPQHHIHAPPTQVRPSAFSSKVSSLHESSSEEEVSTQPEAANSPQLGEKRPHSTQELDFDSPDLQSKSIADLDEVPFSLDPRLPPTKLALDSNGTPLNLSAKLTNLTKMRLDDQTALFRSLTDTEREDTADWFLEKFRADMAKLMAVRTERRKVALKFEMDVKMRERRVHTKREDVEQQLVGLKKGGAELVKAQSPAKGL